VPEGEGGEEEEEEEGRLHDVRCQDFMGVFFCFCKCFDMPFCMMVRVGR